MYRCISGWYTILVSLPVTVGNRASVVMELELELEACLNTVRDPLPSSHVSILGRGGDVIGLLLCYVE